MMNARLPLWLAAGLGVWILAYRLLPAAAEWLTYDLVRLERGEHLSRSVEFFAFETPKVLLLLTLVVFGVGIVRSFVTPARTRRILAGKRESVGNVLAAVLGVATPFCSCSAVPMFRDSSPRRRSWPSGRSWEWTCPCPRSLADE